MRSVRTALAVFEAIADHQPIGLSALARHLDVPKPTVQRSLLDLAAQGWIVQDLLGAGQWTVSAHFAVLTEEAPIIQMTRSVTRPHLTALRDRTGETVALFTLDGDHMVMLDGFDGTRVARAVENRLGPLPIGTSAAGRAMLAALPVARRDAILDRLEARGLTRYTSQTVADRSELVERIKEARRVGYAVLVREYLDDIVAIGAAITGPDGVPVAGLALLAPANRLPERKVRVTGRAVATAAAQITAELNERCDVRPLRVATVDLPVI